MTDEENNKRADLFRDSSVKPLFGSEEPAPAGKPLFDSEFSDPGDAAFVKPLFADSEEEDEPVSLDDFEKFDNIPESDNESYSDVSEEEPIEEFQEAPATEETPFAESGMPTEFNVESAVADSNPFGETPASEKTFSYDEPAAEPGPFEETPAAQENKPPFSEDIFSNEDPFPEPAFTIPATKVNLPGDLEAMSLGALMAYARETAGFTPENVFDGTKINERFLFAIESDQFDKLPSGAFPGAYVRALCSFYHLENNVCEIAQKKAAAYCTACRPPDEVYNNLPKHAVINKEEQEKFRRWITIAGIALLAIIVLVIVLVTASALKSDDSKLPAAASPVTMEELEQLDTAPPPVTATELNVPK